MIASIDPLTKELYVPPRRLAADGSLRRCEPTEILSAGVLRAFTSSGSTFYGLVDLDCEVRVQVRLDEGPHEVGATYQAVDPGGAVFGRA
ncbi:hypothetical protein ACFVWG_20930 [Kribbella sp. NPDC058245]|uniref:hypothetical protein n=1 Tax=Kribbella sp. NPDC058245 TaxID=3346399 RepID=UPI0036EF1947